MDWLVTTRFKVLDEKPCECGRDVCKAHGVMGVLELRLFSRLGIGLAMEVWGRAGREDAMVAIGRRLAYVQTAAHAALMLPLALGLAALL